MKLELKVCYKEQKAFYALIDTEHQVVLETCTNFKPLQELAEKLIGMQNTATEVNKQLKRYTDVQNSI
jgi:hypothetical protein